MPSSYDAISYSLVGLTADVNATDQLSMALDVDRSTMLDVPVALIERIETIGQVTVGTREFPHVRVHLKPPTTPEGRLLTQVAAATENALLTVVNRLVPTVPEPAIRDTCHDCIHNCTMIVVTKQDPFAQIICMLNCPC